MSLARFIRIRRGELNLRLQDLTFNRNLYAGNTLHGQFFADEFCMKCEFIWKWREFKRLAIRDPSPAFPFGCFHLVAYSSVIGED